jgi:hypothetical protein
MFMILSTETDFVNIGEIEAAGNYLTKSFVDNVGRFTMPKEVLANCRVMDGKLNQCLATLGPNGGEGACRYNNNKKRCVNRGKFVDNESAPESEPEPELANCRVMDGNQNQCLAILGPNGGKDACRYNNNKKRCVNRGNFVDNESAPESEPEPELANCQVMDGKPNQCRAILGPNGGEDACRYNKNKNKCLNRGRFVDNEFAPIELAKCGGFDTSKADCLAITGPNGGERACRYNSNRNKCVNRGSFVDNAG